MLAGSTSLICTVTAQLKLRIISLVGLTLIVIWAFSSIGGQASYRQMTIGPRVSTVPVPPTWYPCMEQYDGSQQTTVFPIINALFVTLILSPLSTRLSTVDTWGNVKIPLIENYGNESTPDSERWFVVDKARSAHIPPWRGYPWSA